MQVNTPVNGEMSCQYEWRSSTSFSDTQVHSVKRATVLLDRADRDDLETIMFSRLIYVKNSLPLSTTFEGIFNLCCFVGFF